MYSSLATPSATRAVLEAHGLSTKKSLGQHFLANDAIVGKILDLADIQPGDKVLEVGPGIGTLTVALLAAGANVLAIERDPALPAVLAETCAEWADQLTVLSMDALDAPDKGTGHLSYFAPTKFVANLPYAVAATLVLDYFERFPSLEQATVMVQAEVADRMMAQPGSKDYGAYTVKLGLYAQPVGRFKVGPGNFFPPPRVDSAVIRLNRVGTPSSSNNDTDTFSGIAAQVSSDMQDINALLASLTPEECAAAATMADAAFANRRKTLANSCKTYFSGIQQLPFVGQDSLDSVAPTALEQCPPLTGVQIVEALPAIFEAAGIDPSARGETLALTNFITLGKELLKLYSCIT